MFDGNYHFRQDPYRWRFSWWTGLMYGPLPVGVIVLGTVVVFLLLARG